MIRKVNDVLPGVRRPFRMEDIEFLWEGLSNVLASGVTTTPVILSGFNKNSDNTLSAGVLAFNGQLYMHPDKVGYKIPLDSNVYYESVPSEDDQRNFEDGTVQPMYYYQVLTTNAEGGNLVGQFTEENIAAWRYAGASLDIAIIDVPGISKIVDITQTVASIPFPTASAEKLLDAIQKKKQTYFVDTETGDKVLPFPISAQCVADFSTLPVTDIMGSAIYSNPAVALPVDTSFSMSLSGGTWTLTLSLRNLIIGGTYVTSDGSVEVNQEVDFKTGLKSRGKAVLTDVPDGSVTESKLADDSVTTNKIKNAAVTKDKMARNSVGDIELINGAVNSNKLATKAVTTEKIADLAVGGNQIASTSISTDKLANAAVTNEKLANNAITSAKIGDAQITRTKMADNSVGTATLQDNTVTFPKAILAMQNPIVLTIRITVSNRQILYLYNPYGFDCVYSNPSVGSNSLLLKNLSTIKNQWDANAYLYLTPYIIAEGVGIVINGIFLSWGSSTLSFGTWDVSRNSAYNSQYLFITLIRPLGNVYPA